MTFAPQRMVWMAIWASLLGVAVCLVLALVPHRWWARLPWRRGRRSGAPGEGPGASEGSRGQRRAEGPADAAAVADVEVEAAGPLLVDGVSLSAGRSLALGLAVGVVAAVFLGPWVGVATAAVTAVALGLRRGQVLLRAACVGAFGLAAAFIVAKQLRADYVVDFEWMNNFEITHAWALFAAGLLAVDPLVEVLRRRRRS